MQKDPIFLSASQSQDVLDISFPRSPTSTSGQLHETKKTKTATSLWVNAFGVPRPWAKAAICVMYDLFFYPYLIDMLSTYTQSICPFVILHEYPNMNIL